MSINYHLLCSIGKEILYPAKGGSSNTIIREFIT